MTIESVPDLVSNGVLYPASQPPDNPRHLQFSFYTIPLIQHDYPARTALLWNGSYREFNMDAGNCMLLGEPAGVAQIFSAFRYDERYRGGGMGVGFKEIAFHHVDEFEPVVEHLRAVNLVVKTSAGQLRGYNTDGVGFAQSLAEFFSLTGRMLTGKRILLLGAGGTSSAVAFALADAGCSIIIANRTVGKAEELSIRLNAAAHKSCAKAINSLCIAEHAVECDAIVNVSSVGAAGTLAAYSPLAAVTLPPSPAHIERNRQEAERVLDRISRETMLSDVVLASGGTPFLRMAAARGFPTLDGIPMVVNQAIESFWILHFAELERRGALKPELARVMRELNRSFRSPSAAPASPAESP